MWLKRDQGCEKDGFFYCSRCGYLLDLGVTEEGGPLEIDDHIHCPFCGERHGDFYPTLFKEIKTLRLSMDDALTCIGEVEDEIRITHDYDSALKKIEVFFDRLRVIRSDVEDNV